MPNDVLIDVISVLVAMFLYIFALAFYFFVKWSLLTFDFFKKQKFPFRDPVPLFGTNLNMLTKRKTPTELLDEFYYEFPDEK